MVRVPSQNSRVLARLRQGPLAAVDFQPPNVVDDGPPIWRVAARIDNLRQRGFVIRSERRTDGTAVYHLESEPADVERVGGPSRDATPPLPRPATGSLSTGLFDAGAFADTRPWEDVR